MNPSSSSPLIDRDTVQRLVAEVLRRIQSEAGAATTSTPATTQQAATAASHYGAPDRTGAGTPLPGKVITLSALDRLAPGTRHVVIDAQAVVTPSARDHAKEAGITISRRASAGAAPSVRPFVIAHAQCRGDAAAKSAAIARGVPGAQQIPSAGLAEVIAALAVHASRDAARAVLLTGRPAVATILANRSASLRGVTGRDATSLAAAATESQANLLIVDPASFPGGLERLCAQFAAQPAGSIPDELGTAPPGCGCKGHSH